MFILKNAIKNIKLFKGRNILIFIIFFVISLFCCVSLATWQATNDAQEKIISQMTVSATIGPHENNSLYASIDHLSIGMRISNNSVLIDFDQESLSLDRLKEYGQKEMVKSSDFHIRFNMSGSDNFKNFTLYNTPDFFSVTRSTIAQVAEIDEEVFIVGHNLGENLNDLGDGTLKIIDGRVFDDYKTEYECIVDFSLAEKYDLRPGSKITVQSNNENFEFEITGIYSSTAIETQLKGNFKLKDRVTYWPIIYINISSSDSVISNLEKAVLSDPLSFAMLGYSSDQSLTEFVEGKNYIIKGQLFNPTSGAWECVIPKNLADFNHVKVGDEIILTNSFYQSFPVKVVGIYDSNYNEKVKAISNSPQMQNMRETQTIFVGTMVIPLNKIYMSFSALMNISEMSSESNKELVAIYDFANIDDLNLFYKEVRSQDVNVAKYYFNANGIQDYLDKLTVIQRASNFALISFLISVLFGSIFLVLFNIYNMRERKYEIGVLTAIGMEKAKIAIQFLLELMAVIIVATILSTGLSSRITPPLNEYLNRQNIEVHEARVDAIKQNFGRNTDIVAEDMTPEIINISIDFLVTLELLGIFIILTVISSIGVLVYIFNFEPLKILSEVS